MVCHCTEAKVMNVRPVPGREYKGVSGLHHPQIPEVQERQGPLKPGNPWIYLKNQMLIISLPQARHGHFRNEQTLVLVLKLSKYPMLIYLFSKRPSALQTESITSRHCHVRILQNQLQSPINASLTQNTMQLGYLRPGPFASSLLPIGKFLLPCNTSHTHWSFNPSHRRWFEGGSADLIWTLSLNKNNNNKGISLNGLMSELEKPGLSWRQSPSDRPRDKWLWQGHMFNQRQNQDICPLLSSLVASLAMSCVWALPQNQA